MVEVRQVSTPPHQDRVLDQDPMVQRYKVKIERVYGRPHLPVL